jgi:hypothetical protein
MGTCYEGQPFWEWCKEVAQLMLLEPFPKNNPATDWKTKYYDVGYTSYQAVRVEVTGERHTYLCTPEHAKFLQEKNGKDTIPPHLVEAEKAGADVMKNLLENLPATKSEIFPVPSDGASNNSFPPEAQKH